MAKKASNAPKIPDIYCRRGNPLGDFVVKCNDAFAAAAQLSIEHHKLSGERIHTAAEHITRGLHHLTEVHGIALDAAYKAVAAEVKNRHGLNAAAFQEAVKVVQAHWQHGQKLSEMLLGRSI